MRVSALVAGLLSLPLLKCPESVASWPSNRSCVTLVAVVTLPPCQSSCCSQLVIVSAVTARAAEMTHSRTAYFLQRWLHICNKLCWRQRSRYMIGWMPSYWGTLERRMKNSSYFRAAANRVRVGPQDVLRDWGRVLWACVRYVQQKSRMSKHGHMYRR